MNKAWLCTSSLLVALVTGASGCATELPALANPDQITANLVVGHVVTILKGQRSRRYLPQVRFLELENHVFQKRFRVEINSSDQFCVVDLPAGTYRLTRVQISEGPFLSMADLAVEFSVRDGVITHVGTWQFEIDSPRYGREIRFSVTFDQQEEEQLLIFLNERHRNFNERSIEETLPRPSQVETRLYEVMPYPRYSEYFRRHWW